MNTTPSFKHRHAVYYYVAHGCLITPHTWDDALAGPMPLCYTFVPRSADP